MTPHTSPATLPDDELPREVERLVRNKRGATAAVVRALMELDARRLYLRESCSSLFTYCTQVLRLEEGAAYNRIEVARAARRFPAVLDDLEDRRGHAQRDPAAGAAPHRGQPPRAPRDGAAQEQARGRAARRDTPAQAGCARP